MRIKAIDKIPTAMVGDGGKPNVFFVSLEKDGTVLITRYFGIAYKCWKDLLFTHFGQMPQLEDRRYGTIASVQPKDDSKVSPLMTYDDSPAFLRSHPQHKKSMQWIS